MLLPEHPGLDRLRTFVSPETGLVHELAEELHAPDDSRAIAIGAHSARGDTATGSRLDTWSGSAKPDRAAAEAAAIAEALERYSASYVPDDELVFATAAELGDDAVDPESFALFSRSQYASPGFPYAPFERTTRLRWAKGRALLDGRLVFLPSQLVYSSWRARSDGEPMIGHCTSSGVACGDTRDDARLAGLLELIERDAFMIVWRNRLSLPLLDWSKDDGLLDLERRYFAGTGLEYRVVSLTALAGVPCVFATVRGPAERPGSFGIGAGAGATLDEAWWSALSEAFSVHRWVRDRATTEPASLQVRADAISTFREHSMYYANPSNLPKTDFLDASSQRVDSESIGPVPGGSAAARTEAIAGLLAARGTASYVADVTAPDVRAGGVFVERVVCPQLCQLDVFSSAVFLGGARLTSAPWEAGLAARPTREDELNLDPHPFP